MNYCVVLFDSGLETVEPDFADVLGLEVLFTDAFYKCEKYIADQDLELKDLNGQTEVFHV